MDAVIEEEKKCGVKFKFLVTFTTHARMARRIMRDLRDMQVEMEVSPSRPLLS